MKHHKNQLSDKCACLIKKLLLVSVLVKVPLSNDKSQFKTMVYLPVSGLQGS